MSNKKIAIENSWDHFHGNDFKSETFSDHSIRAMAIVLAHGKMAIPKVI